MSGGHGFKSQPRHTKYVLTIVSDAALHSAQHIKEGLASLSSKLRLENEMDSILKEHSRLINIS